MDRDEVRAKPNAPDLPAYVVDPLEKQSPERLEMVAAYAVELATWKREQREKERDEEEVDPESLEELHERDISTDPDDYKDVPTSGSYITIKETKPGYHYYYWQWRDGNTWKNEYIAPVSKGE
ncbi:hypothetical protein OB919_14320 [Halobacteria archaeon AArc-curdl1]|uniref:Uncharacterized protein n=1 Tax=Natronosalvus hydrolyticus TaxID=2979988 RepID=A0AAP2ZA03_9EURY|nr:hypothetical protein [Halobacteria archaeon AArc-curdl1]